MTTKRRNRQLAPSIQKAHRRVRLAWYGSLLHAALLLGLAVLLLSRPDPAWLLGGLCVAGMGLAPFLGRTLYRGNSFSAFLLLVSVVAPLGVAFLMGRSLSLPLVLFLLTPIYVLGLKGATGLRGRRGSRRERG